MTTDRNRILPAKKDLLCPCPGCGEVKSADAGHHLCRQCEGYSAAALNKEGKEA